MKHDISFKSIQMPNPFKEAKNEGINKREINLKQADPLNISEDDDYITPAISPV
jgi:hypothetical protein